MFIEFTDGLQNIENVSKISKPFFNKDIENLGYSICFTLNNGEQKMITFTTLQKAEKVYNDIKKILVKKC